jgi:hypothetical protein
MALVGGSPNTNQGAGVWGFDTATGGASDFVAARAQEGLHEIALHQVGFDGGKFNVPFQSTVAGASVSPSAVTQHTATGAGAFDVTFKAGIDLPGFNAEAFGLSQPVVKDEVVHQDDPNDPSSASVKETVQIAHASRATFTVDVDSDDVDLFIVHDGQSSRPRPVAPARTSASRSSGPRTAPTRSGSTASPSPARRPSSSGSTSSRAPT